MSQSSTYGSGGGPTPPVITINGDVGSAVGPIITFNALSFGGATLQFKASGSSVYLYASDTNANTLIGFNAGNGTMAGTSNTSLGGSSLNSLTNGSSNTAVGFYALKSATTGSQNSAFGSSSITALTTGSSNSSFGFYSLSKLVTGSYNTSIGYAAGDNYTTSESSNICIGYQTLGTLGESNVLRIGNGTGTGNGQVNKAYIAGINGINVGSVASVVSINGDQLGSATITAGTNISVTPSANTITIAATGAGSFTWSVITADQSASVNNGYICNKAGLLTLTLPTTAAVGTIIEVSGMNTALGWKIAQNANQQIFFGTSSTTSGTGGSLASTNIYDSVRLVCNTANLTWIVLSSVGNITVV